MKSYRIIKINTKDEELLRLGFYPGEMISQYKGYIDKELEKSIEIENL